MLVEDKVEEFSEQPLSAEAVSYSLASVASLGSQRSRITLPIGEGRPVSMPAIQGDKMAAPGLRRGFVGDDGRRLGLAVRLDWSTKTPLRFSPGALTSGWRDGA